MHNDPTENEGSTSKRALTLTSDQTIAHALVLIPLIHALIATIYLFSYCAGFGSGIVHFASIQDIFSVTISDLATIYAYNIILFSFFFWRNHRKTKTRQSVTLRVEDISPLARRHLANPHILYGALIISLLLALLAVSFDIAMSYYTGKPMKWSSIGVPFAGLLGIIGTEIREDFNIKSVPYEIGFAVALTLLVATTQGAGRGQTDRYAEYKYNADRLTSCNGNLILRRISEYYIVTNLNGNKYLVDQDCDVKFSIPSPVPFKERLEIGGKLR